MKGCCRYVGCCRLNWLGLRLVCIGLLVYLLGGVWYLVFWLCWWLVYGCWVVGILVVWCGFCLVVGGIDGCFCWLFWIVIFVGRCFLICWGKGGCWGVDCSGRWLVFWFVICFGSRLGCCGNWLDWGVGKVDWWLYFGGWWLLCCVVCVKFYRVCLFWWSSVWLVLDWCWIRCFCCRYCVVLWWVCLCWYWW